MGVWRRWWADVLGGSTRWSRRVRGGHWEHYRDGFGTEYWLRVPCCWRVRHDSDEERAYRDYFGLDSDTWLACESWPLPEPPPVLVSPYRKSSVDNP